ncbi:uncharacterized mitochondrial protein-like protein [Tanacetum coccineum]
MGLWYPKGSGFELTTFSDADHAGCVDTRKSTSGGIQFLGDKLVSWMSKKQDCTAMSSAEAEYVALSASCAQVMWMRTQLQDYGFNYNKILLYCDSQSAIAISCNVTPPFLHIAAEANLGYYFMDTTIIIIENDFKRDVCSKDTLSFISNQSFTKAGEMDLEAKGGYVTRRGHVGGLEGDEEGLEDVLFKLETSFDVLFSPYRGVANAVVETCWLGNLLRELHTPLSYATLVYCDNVSVVYLSSNPVQHQPTKHIEIDIHFV